MSDNSAVTGFQLQEDTEICRIVVELRRDLVLFTVSAAITTQLLCPGDVLLSTDSDTIGTDTTFLYEHT